MDNFKSPFLKKADELEDKKALIIKGLDRAILSEDPAKIVAFAYSIDKSLDDVDTSEFVWSLLEGKESFWDLFIALPEEFGKLIRKDPYGSIPWLLAPSIFEDHRIKYHSLFFNTCPVEVALEEYIGACYRPGRYEYRFEPGVKEKLIQRIRAEITLKDHFGKMKPEILESGLSTMGVSDLSEIYGEEALRKWWLTYHTGPIRNDPNCDYLVRDLDDFFHSPDLDDD
jgi:hypothetical protein